MAPVVPDPRTIKAFKSEAAFDAWMRRNHSRETEIWLRIYKKGSGRPSVTHAQALDVALCWGWIDGIRKALDEESFLQRYSPRRSRSLWSQVNREHVGRLTGAGRMQPAGQRQVDAARADGRWDAAYAPMRSASAATIPDDLRAAIAANPRARKTFRYAWPSEPLLARLPHEQHEDAGRPGAQDRVTRGDAGARRDDISGTGAEAAREKG